MCVLMLFIRLCTSSFRFFVVEDHILSTTQGLVNRVYMDELWETSVSKIVAVLRTNCVSIQFQVVPMYKYFESRIVKKKLNNNFQVWF